MSEENNSPLDSLDTEKKEENNENQVPEKETGMLSEIIESVKEEKEEEKIKEITSLEDLLFLHTKEGLDYIKISPKENSIEIICIKEAKEYEKYFISFPLYNEIVLKIKEISGMNLSETKKVQDGNGKMKIKEKEYSLSAKTSPAKLWEKVFLKVKQVNTITKKEKKKIPLSQLLGLLWATIFVGLVIGGAFITFIVLNAQTVEDVKFFNSLWISLNDINNFIAGVVNTIFTLLIFVEIIVLAIALFKALLTKKQKRKKKTLFSLISIILLIITFTTGTMWLVIDKKIRNLPNWQEVAYGDIQVFDNEKLISDKFKKEGALIRNTTNLIGPITLKYDLSLFDKRESQRGFTIKKYIWDFGDGREIEELNPNIIKRFDKKGTYNVSLIVEGTDIAGKTIQKEIEDVKDISITSLVEINEKKTSDGWIQVEFDASDLKELGKIEWYFEEDTENPVYEGNIFKPAKIFYEEQLIGMYIRSDESKKDVFNKIFVIGGEQESSISWKISYEQSILNELKYTFRVENIENDFGNGFISEFKWIIDDKTITKEADVLDIEGSSEIEHNFSKYGDHTISVVLTDGNGNEKTFSTSISILKSLKIEEGLTIRNNGTKIGNSQLQYEPKTREYFISDLGVPTNLEFDGRNLKTDNDFNYSLKEINWDFDNDRNTDASGNIGSYNFETEGNFTVSVKYLFENRKIPEEKIEIEEKIFIEAVKKEAILNLKIEKESDYVPVLVRFDASLSQVKNDDIVKFIYDYGDGVKEERDAINPWHLYTQAWDYIVKLTIKTKKGKEYSIQKDLILKPKPQIAKIGVSMKEAPPWQGIDFSSDESEGQIISYLWNFWDGTMSTDANPTHAYKKEWTYTVKLKVGFINNNFQEDSVEIQINYE